MNVIFGIEYILFHFTYFLNFPFFQSQDGHSLMYLMLEMLSKMSEPNMLKSLKYLLVQVNLRQLRSLTSVFNLKRKCFSLSGKLLEW